jgi:hypothetical protein
VKGKMNHALPPLLSFTITPLQAFDHAWHGPWRWRRHLPVTRQTTATPVAGRLFVRDPSACDADTTR